MNYFTNRKWLPMLLMGVIPVVAEAQLTTQTFTYTGAVQVFNVPSCVSDITITARGAQGGTGGNAGANGGSVRGVLSVTAGQVLNVYVGGKGSTPGGGFNGGGAGGVSIQSTGGGGGGASDVRLNGTALTDRIIVAGGGGGYGGSTSYGPAAGTGGGGNPCASPLGYGGANGTGCSSGNVGGCAGGTAPNYGTGGGGGGLSSGGGIAGTVGQGGLGQAGTLGFGGDGGDLTNNGQNGGGGGGGGYYGGSGGMSGNGGCNGGGGGGSSYADNALFTSVTFTGGNQANDGVVIFEYIYAGSQVTATAVSPTICVGQTTTLNATGVVSYTWVNGPQSTSMAVSPQTTTSYTIEGTNSIGCVSAMVVTVDVRPLPVLATSSTPSVVCVGGTASLSATGAVSYTWNTNQQGADVTDSPVTSTVYTVTGTSIDGCINTQTLGVTVNTNSLTVTPASSVCVGDALVMTASGANSYTWTSGSFFPTSQVSPAASTVYVVSGTDVHNCVISNSVNVSVLQRPNVAASAEKIQVCKGEPVKLTASGAVTYTWDTGDTGAEVTYTLASDVPYTWFVTGADNNGCTKTASVQVVASKCTGIAEEGRITGLSIYPNPGQGLFTLNLEAAAPGAQVMVYNSLGELVSEISPADKAAVIDLRDKAKGIYVISLVEANGNVHLAKVLNQ